MTINIFLKNNKNRVPSLSKKLGFRNAARSETAKGFTLIEALVAITVLILSVVGPISLIGDAVHKLFYVRDEVVAINLAQEGLEAVRQVRDNNMIAGAAWDTGFNGQSYVVDIGGVSLLSACSGCDQKVYFDTVTDLYRQGGVFDTNTQFSRVITISSAGLGANERNITSSVTWNTASDIGTVSISENLYNWSS